MANELLYVPGVGTRYFYDKNKLGTVLLAEIGASNWKSGLVDGHPCFTLSGTAFKFTTGSAFTGSHTVEYWLKLDDWTNAGTAHLFGNSRYNNFYGVAPVVVSGGNNISLKLYFDFTGSGDQTTTVTLPNQSGWVHIAAVYEYGASNYKVNLYVNGTKVAEHYLQLMGSMRLLFGGSITGDSDTTLHDAFVGKMANIIVSSGVKYTANFTPAWAKVDVSALTESGDKMHNFTSPEIEYLDAGNIPYKISADLTGALAGKANADLSNCPANYDYVVDSQILSDGSWYRKYKSGWLEQGGKSAAVEPGGNTIVTFSKAFANTTYTVLAQVCGGYTAQAEANAPITAQTKTGFTIYSGSYATSTFNWRAIGQGAN